MYFFLHAFLLCRNGRSRQFIESLNDIVKIITVNKSDSSDDNPVDEKNTTFLDSASPGDDDEAIVTISDAYSKCNEDTFILPLNHIFLWTKLSTLR